MTSHAVVSRARKALGERRIGHAGTLDPDATGVLVLGVGQATRLLGYLSASDKDYVATVRLGVATTTDDAAGDVVSVGPIAGIHDSDVDRAVADLTGPISQRPSAVSAIKVDGRRAHARVREGEDVVLPERDVVVSRFRRGPLRHQVDDAGREVIDLDIEVTCSAGTYVRALARDMGAALGVGGHLRSLRRTRSGAFGIDMAVQLDALSPDVVLIDPAVAVARSLGAVEVDAETATRVGKGIRVAWPAGAPVGSVIGVVHAGRLVALASADAPGAPTSYAAVFPPD